MTKSQKGRLQASAPSNLAGNRFRSMIGTSPLKIGQNRAALGEITPRRSTRAAYRAKPRALHVAFLP